MRSMTAVITRMKITVVGEITFQGVQIKENTLKANFVTQICLSFSKASLEVSRSEFELKEIQLEIISSCLMLCGHSHLYVPKIM